MISAKKKIYRKENKAENYLAHTAMCLHKVLFDRVFLIKIFGLSQRYLIESFLSFLELSVMFYLTSNMRGKQREIN
jgi:hypothetical protein